LDAGFRWKATRPWPGHRNQEQARKQLVTTLRSVVDEEVSFPDLEGATQSDHQSVRRTLPIDPTTNLVTVADHHHQAVVHCEAP
jgi:hypothetical protein